MGQNSGYKIILAFVLVSGLILGSCMEGKSLTSSPVLNSSPTPFQVLTVTHSILTDTPVPMDTSTPLIPVVDTLEPMDNGRATFIITPEVLFSIPGIEIKNTPYSTDFCKHVPPVDVVKGANDISLLSGRFSLCTSIYWHSAIDLDHGNFVKVDSVDGDIAMDFNHTGLNGVISYYVTALNNAHIDKVDTNVLTYQYCKNSMLSLGRPGVLLVQEGAIACVLTTDGNVALVRVENIYPFETESVEFSFVILKEK